MFRLISNGPEGGDCTAPYIVELNGEYTVRTFIQDVLKVKDEWGRISIDISKGFFGDPSCEYSKGRLLNALPDNYLDLKVVSAKAHGGWSMMNYVLKVDVVHDTPYNVTEHYCIRKEDIFGGTMYVVYRIGHVEPGHAIAGFKHRAAAINECKYLERLNAEPEGEEDV